MASTNSLFPAAQRGVMKHWENAGRKEMEITGAHLLVVETR